MSLPALTKRLALVWGVVLIALNYVALMRIGTGKAKLPDLQGYYTSDAVREYLRALTPESRSVYLETYLPLDFLFIALTLVLLLMLARVLAVRAVWLVAGFAAIFVIADLVENFTLRGLVLDRNAALCFFGCEAVFDRLIWASRVKFAGLAGAAIPLIIAFWRGRTQ